MITPIVPGVETAPPSYDVARLYYEAFHGERKPSKEILHRILHDLVPMESHGLLDSSDRLVGAVSFVVNAGLSFTEVKQLAVLPERHRHGYGTVLMQHVETVAVEQGSASIRLLSNGPSVPFYEKQGFVRLQPGSAEMVKSI